MNMNVKSNEVMAGVVGWPITHSRSPTIHRYWLQKYGINGSYDKFAVAPEDFTEFLDTQCRRKLQGLNVTIPLKELALDLCDEVETVAQEIGAVNTIWVENEKLLGTNTDAYGFTANLDQKYPNWDSQLESITVIGAGGAAKAIVWALVNRGCQVVNIVNRTLTRAEELASKYQSCVYPYDWTALDKLLESSSMIINTTSLGMTGQEALEIDVSLLPDEAIVSDIVYTPLITNFLRSAENRELRTIDGLGMLLFQAVPGFEKWFGMRPEVTNELRNCVITDLGLE